jgi:hypothetical protein
MSQFATAKRDTYINLMRDVDTEFAIPEGKWLFHITSPTQVKYLEPGEIAVWDMTTGGVCYGYAKDWEVSSEL